MGLRGAGISEDAEDDYDDDDADKDNDDESSFVIPLCLLA